MMSKKIDHEAKTIPAKEWTLTSPIFFPKDTHPHGSKGLG
jgi:hypothetical protein